MNTDVTPLNLSAASKRDSSGQRQDVERKFFLMKLDWKRVVRTMKSFTLRIFILIFVTVAANSCSKGSKDKPVLLGQKDQSRITGKVSGAFLNQ
jgi:hypothetical protein